MLYLSFDLFRWLSNQFVEKTMAAHSKFLMLGVVLTLLLLLLKVLLCPSHVLCEFLGLYIYIYIYKLNHQMVYGQWQMVNGKRQMVNR